jgi:hypothetical protein
LGSGLERWSFDLAVNYFLKAGRCVRMEAPPKSSTEGRDLKKDDVRKELVLLVWLIDEWKSMKHTSCFILCLSIIFASCTKTKEDVHFHGRITLDCNNNLPVKNASVDIFRYYDTGMEEVQFIGTALTDDSGYYSLIADVKQKGVFMYYGIYILSKDSLYPISGGNTESNDNSTNVEINFQSDREKTYGFHIKNTVPFDNNDVFDSLLISRSDSPGSFHNYFGNLIGSNVDTTFYTHSTTQIVYKYLFKKNNITMTSSETTISNLNCLDTLNINIFY